MKYLIDTDVLVDNLRGRSKLDEKIPDFWKLVRNP